MDGMVWPCLSKEWACFSVAKSRLSLLCFSAERGGFYLGIYKWQGVAGGVLFAAAAQALQSAGILLHDFAIGCVGKHLRRRISNNRFELHVQKIGIIEPAGLHFLSAQELYA